MVIFGEKFLKIIGQFFHAVIIKCSDQMLQTGTCVILENELEGCVTKPILFSKETCY